MQPRLLLLLMLSGEPALAAPSALTTESRLAGEIKAAALREELQQEVAVALARHGYLTQSGKLAATLPPFRHAVVLLLIAEQLPKNRSAEAEKMLLEAQTDRALTKDWHKNRLTRLLAGAYAKLGHFDIAVAMAAEVPDGEDRAFAQREVITALCAAGNVARARELAGSIEENRRYGTYRQKAGALSDVARTLNARGDTDGAATLLAQAELLLPKKPGWSDGGAMLEVAIVAYQCGELEKSHALLLRAETLAQAITGTWKVSELAHLAAAWRTCGDIERASARLTDAEKFLATLPPLERAAEALVLARAHVAAAHPDNARRLLGMTLADATRAEPTDAWRAIHIRTQLAWSELLGEAPRPKT